MRKEEVTVRDWEGAESCPGCRCASRPGRTAASGERGEGHPLLPSERGLSSSGERPSPTSGSPLGTAGLPARCERMESIPKPVEPSMAPARCRRSHRHWRGGRGGSGLVMVINNNGDDNNKKRKEKKKKKEKNLKGKKKKEQSSAWDPGNNCCRALRGAARYIQGCSVFSIAPSCTQTDRQEKGEREAESNFGRRGGGEGGGRTPTSPGAPSRPPHPCPEPRGWGLPAGGGEAAIDSEGSAAP